jgi:hypothetical protein
MKIDAPTGDRYRVGAFANAPNPKSKVMCEEHSTKRSKETGRFMEQNSDGAKFTGVRKESN